MAIMHISTITIPHTITSVLLGIAPPFALPCVHSTIAAEKSNPSFLAAVVAVACQGLRARSPGQPRAAPGIISRLGAAGPEFPFCQGQEDCVAQEQYAQQEGEYLGLRCGKHDPLADTGHREEEYQTRHHVHP